MIFIGWIVFSIIAGAIGSDRKIGFWPAFFVSLILSPLIGFIIVFFSKNIEDEKYKEKVLESATNQEEALKKITELEKTNISIADELEKLIKLKETNQITEEEFDSLKKKLIS